MENVNPEIIPLFRLHEESLIISAQTLKQPSEPAIKTFQEKIRIVAEQVNHTMSARPDITHLISHKNMDIMEYHSHNLLRFVGTTVLNYDPRTFVQTSLWAFRVYRSNSFFVTFWYVNLDSTLLTLKQELPKQVYNEIAPFFEWLIFHSTEFLQITDSRKKEGTGPDRY